VIETEGVSIDADRGQTPITPVTHRGQLSLPFTSVLPSSSVPGYKCTNWFNASTFILA
jgi:hypothetical protein